jgi:hypothetical protein
MPGESDEFARICRELDRMQSRILELRNVEYNQPGGTNMSTSNLNPTNLPPASPVPPATGGGPLTLGPFGVGNQPQVPVAPAPPVPPVPVNLQKYGNLTDPLVYMQGVTSSQIVNGQTQVAPLDSLYFATWQTAREVLELLNGIGIKRVNVGASEPQLMVTIPQHMMVNGKLQTVSVDYIAGLLADGLYHGDVKPTNASSLG